MPKLLWGVGLKPRLYWLIGSEQLEDAFSKIGLPQGKNFTMERKERELGRP